MKQNTTLNNPGSLSRYSFKSWRNIVSSILSKIGMGEFQMALKFLVSEMANKIDRQKIIGGTGKYYCPVCGNHSDSFVHLSNKMRFSWNSACYHCSSRPRHRGLYYLYTDLVAQLKPDQKILHFAPEPAFYALLKDKKFSYHTTDFLLRDVDLPGQDIQNLIIVDNSYDVVLCNHVIEHIEHDQKALTEVYRILKPGGRLFLTIPGDFKRKETIYFSDLRNNGHYRDYGSDFIGIFSRIFPRWEVIDLHDYTRGRNLAIPEFEWVFIGMKA